MAHRLDTQFQKDGATTRHGVHPLVAESRILCDESRRLVKQTKELIDATKRELEVDRWTKSRRQIHSSTR
jgi:hypothetical protein